MQNLTSGRVSRGLAGLLLQVCEPQPTGTVTAVQTSQPWGLRLGSTPVPTAYSREAWEMLWPVQEALTPTSRPTSPIPH